MGFNPNYLSVYPNQFSINPSLMQQNMNQPQFQIQNGGFVCVSSEEEARKYPVAYGNSVTFKNENAPYVYTKTMGFSQLDRPLFEKFRLVKEEDAEVNTQEGDTTPSQKQYLLQEDLDPLVKDIKKIQTKIRDMDSVLEGLKSSCSNSEKQQNLNKPKGNEKEAK